MALVVAGAVTTLDEDQPHIRNGAIYIDDSGMIEAVQSATDAPPTGYDEARRVITEAAVYPGLIDLHNHLAYNFRSLWIPPRDEPYTRRDQWPRESAYATDIRAPANAMGAAAPKAMLKYAEAKALVGGVTAVQGSAVLSHPYEGWLVRNIEYETFGTGHKGAYQSVRRLSVPDLTPYAQKMEEGASFIYHLCEGTAPALLEEYDDLKQSGCLGQRLIAIHGTALTADQYAEWGPRGGAMVWSPFSNLWLYAATSDVVAAQERGITVCLGADWAPSGSKNLLGELKVADLWNRRELDSVFSDEDLCAMATRNAAFALGWEDRVGKISPGRLADLCVVTRKRDDPFRNLIDATERDVWLVLVGGRPLYGRPHLMRDAGALNPEPISVAGIRRSISLLDPAQRDADMTWRQVVADLEAARADPESFSLQAVPFGPDDEPLRVYPDMPGDITDPGVAFGDLEGVTMPPIDSLHHDVAFFRAIESAPIARGLFDGLKDYYF